MEDKIIKEAKKWADPFIAGQKETAENSFRNGVWFALDNLLKEGKKEWMSVEGIRGKKHLIKISEIDNVESISDQRYPSIRSVIGLKDNKSIQCVASYEYIIKIITA